MQATFLNITNILKSYQVYWRQDPFFQVVNGCTDWQSTNPDLYQWILGLSPQEIVAYKQYPKTLLNDVVNYLPQIKQLEQQSQLPSLPVKSQTLSNHMAAGIPGRKREQIEALGSACIDQHKGNQWLEWCSGKGYLGRLLAANSGQKVTSFEYQQPLCDAGQSEADKLNLPMTFVQGDAFDVDSQQLFDSQQHAVALHACGDLHTTLLRHAVKHNLAAISFSPCCYHLIEESLYRPLSTVAQQHDLALNKQQLRIPLQATVTGGERVKRHREQEMIYRLGFDALCREHRLTQCYLPVPSIKKSQLAEGFQAFCQWAAQKKSLTLPCYQQQEFTYFEQIGVQRYWQMEALSLVQDLFRRPLEVWLALDKWLYLEQNRYQVTISTFCEPSCTPRNLLIQGKKITGE
ncbi:methyltransferase [Vibrio hippocampi]|uniref:Methyltransferase domain-containing protein n=1 Tax=Vibrio hippocampi TaxID=654686 RepID=A0ABN8DHU9_9VIBR|nr:methyltransferase [Vibrio hippocampi]CAH0526503.1 hypothetical protein VHP8226_01857 [Vibrio hippocampi]